MVISLKEDLFFISLRKNLFFIRLIENLFFISLGDDMLITREAIGYKSERGSEGICWLNVLILIHGTY